VLFLPPKTRTQSALGFPGIELPDPAIEQSSNFVFSAKLVHPKIVPLFVTLFVPKTKAGFATIGSWNSSRVPELERIDTDSEES
jgi:hypothetical protein